MRAFVALELEPETQADVAGLVETLAPQVRVVRWVRSEGAHLTLRFLGASSPERLGRLEPELERAARACPAAVAPLGPLGTFPERGAPRVLWLALDVPPAVIELQQACERAAVAAGFEPEPRRFRAHLTLGRFTDRVPRPELPRPELAPAPLKSLALLRSTLGRGGAVYTPIARFALGQP